MSDNFFPFFYFTESSSVRKLGKFCKSSPQLQKSPVYQISLTLIRSPFFVLLHLVSHLAPSNRISLPSSPPTPRPSSVRSSAFVRSSSRQYWFLPVSLDARSTVGSYHWDVRPNTVLGIRRMQLRSLSQASLSKQVCKVSVFS